MALAPFFSRDLFTPSEDVFGSVFRPFEGSRDLSMPRPMPLDVKELDDKFEIHADIPGVKKEDIQVNVDQNILSIKVESQEEKKEEKDESGIKWHRTERTSRFMQRALRLPENADMDTIKARYENGVLELNVPKKRTNGKDAGKRIAVNWAPSVRQLEGDNKNALIETAFPTARHILNGKSELMKDE